MARIENMSELASAVYLVQRIIYDLPRRNEDSVMDPVERDGIKCLLDLISGELEAIHHAGVEV